MPPIVGDAKVLVGVASSVVQYPERENSEFIFPGKEKISGGIRDRDREGGERHIWEVQPIRRRWKILQKYLPRRIDLLRPVPVRPNMMFFSLSST